MIGPDCQRYGPEPALILNLTSFKTALRTRPFQPMIASIKAKPDGRLGW